MKNSVTGSTDKHITKPSMLIALLYHCRNELNYTPILRHKNLPGEPE
jgi:hypothetical protein